MPTPPPSPPSANLAPLPTSSSSPVDWGVYDVLPNVADCYDNIDPTTLGPDGLPSVACEPVMNANDQPVTYHGIAPPPGPMGYGDREIDSLYFSVVPGDHIVFSFWVKTGPSGGQQPNAGSSYWNPAAGGGWDWFGSRGRIAALYSNAQEEDAAGVPWNTGWTLCTINLIVPSTVAYDDSGLGSYSSGQQVEPTGLILTIGADVWDSGQAWFADAQLTINP